MAYLFRPPWRRNIVTLAGRGLRYSYHVSLTVYNPGTGWVAVETPDPETLAASEWVLPGEVSDRPQIISDARAAQMLAVLADINASIPQSDFYTFASCTPIEA